MEKKIDKVVRITIHPTVKEARYLRDMLQNTRFPRLEDEPDEETQLRGHLFDTFKEICKEVEE